MPGQHTEKAFESAIENHLLSAGDYAKSEPEAFDRERCLDTTVLLPFIRETQSKEWEYLKALQKERAEETLLDDLCRAILEYVYAGPRLVAMVKTRIEELKKG